MSISCVLNRRSVREYTGESVSEEQLHMLLKAGMYACSALNEQPWEFIVITQKNLLQKLSDGCMYWKPLVNAALAIVVTAYPKSARCDSDGWFIQDCAASSQNILNAAAGLGLGGVWLGCYPLQERIDYVRDTLQIPNDVTPFSILSIGYPKQQVEPHNFYHKDKVHWEMY